MAFYRHNYVEPIKGDPSITNLTASILRETLSILTLEEMIRYYMVYGTTFIINDGKVIDFI